MAFVIAAVFSVLLWQTSNRMRDRFADCEHVTMSWGFNGKPNWRPIKRVAFIFTPVVGTLTLLAVAAMIRFATPANDRTDALSALLVLGVTFVILHYVHLRHAGRSP